MLMMAYMSLMVNTRNASWLQVHKTLSDSKHGRNANTNAQATASSDEDALGQFAQQIDEMISYQNKQPRSSSYSLMKLRSLSYQMRTCSNGCVSS